MSPWIDSSEQVLDHDALLQEEYSDEDDLPVASGDDIDEDALVIHLSISIVAIPAAIFGCLWCIANFMYGEITMQTDSEEAATGPESPASDEEEELSGEDEDVQEDSSNDEEWEELSDSDYEDLPEGWWSYENIDVIHSLVITAILAILAKYMPELLHVAILILIISLF